LGQDGDTAEDDAMEQGHDDVVVLLAAAQAKQ
jgi:hypothetical protein